MAAGSAVAGIDARAAGGEEQWRGAGSQARAANEGGGGEEARAAGKQQAGGEARSSPGGDQEPTTPSPPSS